MPLDTWLFNLINGLAGQVPAVDSLMRLLVNDYFVPTTLCLLIAALWFGGNSKQERRSNQRAVLSIIVAALLANLVVKFCNLIYFRPRPFSVQEVNLLFYRPSDSSLPANSAAVVFAFAGVAWQRHRRLGVVMGILGGLFVFARIYCGVHYPLDVIAGGLVGFVAAYVVGRSQRILEPLMRAMVGMARRFYLA
ncbi:MAG: phosphatase PAP2 family protein [Anaerolineae bacterium]|nr:phosphatase PAP2 family protein [Anaerolineae bacterium]NIN93675.1 phosphatase PAP2 family protein [Anaerolineae bacterium]NIQ76722.1 phosphatase PAP2 family protein [Anaerolineae bacterium]